LFLLNTIANADQVIRTLGSVELKLLGIGLFFRQMKKALINAPLAFYKDRSVLQDCLYKGSVKDGARLASIDHNVPYVRDVDYFVLMILQYLLNSFTAKQEHTVGKDPAMAVRFLISDPSLNQ